MNAITSCIKNTLSSETFTAWKDTINLQKIKIFVRKLFEIIGHAFLFLINPTLYAITFIAAILWSEQIERSIERIERVWKNQSWKAFGVLLIGAYLAVQVTGAALSIHYAAKLGLSFYKNSLETPN